MKKITSLMLVFVLAFSLTGCGILPKRLISAVKDRVKPDRETETTISDEEESLETEETAEIKEIEEDSLFDELKETQEKNGLNENMLSDNVTEYQEIKAGGFVFSIPDRYKNEESNDHIEYILGDEVVLDFVPDKIESYEVKKMI